MLMLNKDKSRTHHTHKTIKYCLPNIMKYKNSSNVYCRNPRNAFSIQSCGTTKNRTIVKSTIKNKTLKLDVNGTTKGQIYKLITFLFFSLINHYILTNYFDCTLCSQACSTLRHIHTLSYSYL
jgi:hypothetical protein